MTTIAELENLKDAVMLAADPKEDRHMMGFVVATAWERNGDPDDAVLDFIGTPPEIMTRILHAIKEMPIP